MIGGATTSARHTAVKIAPKYSGDIVHVLDASRAAGVVEKLINPEMVEIVRIEPGCDYAMRLHTLVAEHLERTESGKAALLLHDWPGALTKFWRVQPKGGLAEPIAMKSVQAAKP